MFMHAKTLFLYTTILKQEKHFKKHYSRLFQRLITVLNFSKMKKFVYCTVIGKTASTSVSPPAFAILPALTPFADFAGS